MKWLAWAGGCVVAAGLVTGCDRGAPTAGEPVPAPAAVEAGPAVVDDGAGGSLHERAARALAAQRVLSPAGDNAVEFYLAARARGEEEARAQAALVELQPYLLIASEQALLRGDAAEAARVLALIERIDAQAPALPRLRDGLARLHREQEAQARIAAAAAAAPAAIAAPVPNAAAPAVAGAGTPPPAARTPPPTTVDAAASPASSPVAASGSPAAEVPSPPPPVPPPARTAQAEASPAPAPMARTPRLLQDAQPRYPLPALRAQIEGQAEVAFTIQPDGSVRNVQLVSSTPSGLFDASAIAVAQRWRFEATGQSHTSRRTVLFRLPAGSDRGG